MSRKQKSEIKKSKTMKNTIKKLKKIMVMLFIVVATSIITTITCHYVIKIWHKKQTKTEIIEEDFIIVKKVFRPSVVSTTYTYWHDSVLRNIITKCHPEEIEMYARKLAIEEFDTTLIKIPIKNREWFTCIGVGDTIKIPKKIKVTKKKQSQMIAMPEPLKAIVKEITYFPETIEKNVQRKIKKDGITRTEIIDIYQQEYFYLKCSNLDGTEIVGHIHRYTNKKTSSVPLINDTIIIKHKKGSVVHTTLFKK